MKYCQLKSTSRFFGTNAMLIDVRCKYGIRGLWAEFVPFRGHKQHAVHIAWVIPVSDDKSACDMLRRQGRRRLQRLRSISSCLATSSPPVE